MVLDWVPKAPHRIAVRNAWEPSPDSFLVPCPRPYKDADVGQLKNRQSPNRRADVRIHPKTAAAVRPEGVGGYLEGRHPMTR
jgi:hypothetical protein